MPEIGEIRKGHEIGLSDHNPHIWAACIKCGIPRWAVVRHGEILSKYCRPCGCTIAVRRGPATSWWKGGRHLTGDGYVHVWIDPTDFYAAMANKYRSIVLEHRLVMAKSLGRCLAPFEQVHHKNGIKDDNRIENLELSTANSHIKDHNKGYRDGYQKGLCDAHESRIKALESRVTTLEAENALLRGQYAHS